MTSRSRALYSVLSSVFHSMASDMYGFGRSPPGRGWGVAMSAHCRRMGAGTVGVEWGGNGWPVLRSTQDVEGEARESVEHAPAQTAPGSDAQSRGTEEEDK